VLPVASAVTRLNGGSRKQHSVAKSTVCLLGSAVSIRGAALALH
jgi:hypothetical protein